MKDAPRVRPLGDRAASVEFGDDIDPELNARVRALASSLEEARVPGILETVPTYRSLLVCYDPRELTLSRLGEVVSARGARGAVETEGSLVTVPTLYGGEAGPDLPEVARRLGLTEAAVVSLHSGGEYRAFMLGFTPGFAYLGLLPEGLETPRRATPRVRVPAGSVGIVGRQTGIYPSASAGGWNLVGRTSLRLFDPTKDPPSLVLPGDRVRFQPVPELPGPPAASTAGTIREASVDVLDGGLLTTVQDRGRRGYRRFGVSWAGALDEPALVAANRLVGNPDGAAALELTVAGPTLRFERATSFALTGADLDPVLSRSDLGEWPVPSGCRVLARPGNTLSFRGRRRGCRAYLSFEGGIDVPEVLSSRATDLGGGFGGLEGRALRAGDRLGLGKERGAARLAQWLEPGSAPTEVTLRVVLGPQEGHLQDESKARLLGDSFSVAPTSDRVACRLAGEALKHRGPAEIVSDGMVPGSIQVPPDGQPIVMMAGGPTTGGYPKPATVVTADLPLLAQLVPGESRVRFRAVPLEEAQSFSPGAEGNGP